MTGLRQAYRRLLRLGFRLLYNELAFSYDLVSWTVSLGQWRSWQRASRHHVRGSRVLEVAFGTGDLLLDLQAAGANVFGIDLSPYMIGVTRRKLRRRGITLPLCRGAVEALPFADGAFDSLVATFPPPFVRDPRVPNEMARVLRPSGRLVIVDQAKLLRPVLVARFIDWLYRATEQQPEWDLSLAQLLARAGWQTQEYLETCPRSVAHVIVAEYVG
jgi:ubiquinone/menaquinone biosynthesis C-methylase UbiE